MLWCLQKKIKKKRTVLWTNATLMFSLVHCSFRDIWQRCDIFCICLDFIFHCFFYAHIKTFIRTWILCCCCCLCFEFSIWSSDGFHLFLSFVFLVLKRFVIRYYNLTSCMNKNNCNCFVSFHVKKMLCCSSSVGPYLWGFDACIFLYDYVVRHLRVFAFESMMEKYVGVYIVCNET